MKKNGWILLLVLICVAFLVSCSKKEETQIDRGELVKVETEREYALSSLPFLYING